MDINGEKENIFKAIDLYLRELDEDDIIGALEDLVCEYTKSRDISLRWLEMY